MFGCSSTFTLWTTFRNNNSWKSSDTLDFRTSGWSRWWNLTKQCVCVRVVSVGLLTLVYLQDGVRHGGEEPVSLQDENVPQAKGQRERRLQEHEHIRSPYRCQSVGFVYAGGLTYLQLSPWPESGGLFGSFPDLRGPRAPPSRATQRDGEVLTAAESCQTTTTGLWACMEETNSSLA